MTDLSTVEEMVLLAIWKLKGNAYGVTIRQNLSDTTQRVFPYGTLYSVLSKLENRGFATKRISDPIPERGGRSKNFYDITPEGIAALKTALELKQALWDEDTRISLQKG